jgi:hypothetical protein
VDGSKHSIEYQSINTSLGSAARSESAIRLKIYMYYRDPQAAGIVVAYDHAERARREGSSGCRGIVCVLYSLAKAALLHEFAVASFVEKAAKFGSGYTYTRR